MSSPTSAVAKIFRGLKCLLLAGLVVWGAWCGWQLWHARGAGAALRDFLRREATTSVGSRPAARDGLIAAAEHLGQGQFAEAARTLSPASRLSAAQQEAAKRFLGKQSALRRRMIAAATAAEKRQRDGGDVTAAQTALVHALAAAAVGDTRSVACQLDAAEAALDRRGTSGRAEAWPTGAPGVAARAAALQSSVQVGRELMTEGYAAAGRLVGRSAWHCRNQQYGAAAELLDLAAELLGVSPAPAVTGIVPAWFLDLAQAPPTGANATRAEAAVQLAEAIARAEAPSPAVTALVDKARRKFDAGEMAEADWWASVALAALGMDPAAAEAASDTKPAHDNATPQRSQAATGERDEESEP